MTLRELLGTIRLRWYVAAVIAVLTLAAAWKVDHPPRFYQATSVLLLKPPKAPDAPNSLAAVTPSIARTGVLVDTILTDATSADRLKRAGVTGDFTLAPRNNGTIQTPRYTVPAEQLTVNSSDPNAAVNSVAILSGLYTQELDDLQARAGVRAVDRITTQVLVPPTAVPVIGSKSRGLIGVAAIGAIALVLLPVWFDRLARRRGRRAAARKDPAGLEELAELSPAAPAPAGAPGTKSPRKRFAA